MAKNKIYFRKGYKYQLARNYYDRTPIRPENKIETQFIMLDIKGNLIILSGYAWDGPSGPTKDDKTNMRPSLVHDALCQLMRLKELSRRGYRKIVDDIFIRMCKEDGMSRRRRWYWNRGVRIGSWSASKPKNAKKVYTAP